MSTKFEVTTCSYIDLPAEVDRRLLSNNGVGKENAEYLLIWIDGKMVECQSTAMEPEDILFCRDLSWVERAIEAAFKLGKISS